MCRIVGYKSTGDTLINPIILSKMRDSMAHGGPDASNNYINEDKKIGFGHRRLSILDLSEAGNQPIRYKHWVIIYNGEIYNFKEIKKALNLIGYTFDTDTDTEMILKAYEAWGLDCVERFRGMFAFAIWDEKQHELILCRDRVGVKPLYYYQKGSLFMFASEIKAFHEHPEFDKSLDFNAVGLFLEQGYIQSPYSIFQNVKKVRPGTFLKVSKSNELKIIPYWNIVDVHNKSTTCTDSEAEVEERLQEILKESFHYRMVADVPVGMFLSGGIDSSLVTALLQKHSNQQLKTFTIGFGDEKYNEAVHAKKVSEHIGTDHTELYCGIDEFEKWIPNLPEFYDEPLGAGSAIPTFLVSKLAKESVKVSLSADGGDEIFGGYTKYEMSKNIYSKLGKIPQPFRKLGNKLLGPINGKFVEDRLSKLPYLSNYTNVGTKFHKFKNALPAESLIDFFQKSSRIIAEKELNKLFSHSAYRPDLNLLSAHDKRSLSLLGAIDIMSFLEGEVMVKVDRASMRVGLEGREPFLDQQIIEYGLSLPDHLKIRGNTTKYILRKILYKYVPRELIERPKQGFDIPMRQWTQGFLKEEIVEMSMDDEFLDAFKLDTIEIQSLISKYMSDYSTTDPHFVWYLYVLYKWYHKWIKK